MQQLVGTPLYARQLLALEALQIYGPLGHGLGLRALSAQLEDSSFQVHLRLRTRQKHMVFFDSKRLSFFIASMLSVIGGWRVQHVQQMQQSSCQ